MVMLFIQTIYLNLFEELVGGVCISVGQGRVDGQRDARPQDGQQDEDLEPFCFGYLQEMMVCFKAQR